MPFDPRSNRPSRTYHPTPRDAAGTALFWALVVVACLGIWVFAATIGDGVRSDFPAQPKIVVPDSGETSG